MSRYLAVLGVPHVTPLVAATLLARFPIGINALAIILYLRAERGSFAVAGAVAAVLVLCGIVAGVAIPPTSSVLRSMWPVTAFVGGIAVGSALAGTLVEEASWHAAFLAAGAIAAIGTLVAVARRGTVAQAAVGAS
jgi:hypothetical protein